MQRIKPTHLSLQLFALREVLLVEDAMNWAMDSQFRAPIRFTASISALSSCITSMSAPLEYEFAVSVDAGVTVITSALQVLLTAAPAATPQLMLL